MLNYRYRSQRNWGARVHESSTMGMATVVLENRFLCITVLVEKGTDIIEFLYKPIDVDLTWLTAGGIRDPRSYLSTSPDPLGTFTDYYPGGWQEVFPSGGAPSEHNGASFGQHGEVANLPWDYGITTDTEAEVAVTFRVRTQRTPFLIEKTLRLTADEATLQIEEQITNESDVPLRAMWGHHLAFGRPFLAPGDRIEMPEGLKVIPHANNMEPSGRRVQLEEGYWPLVRGADGTDLDLHLLPEPGTPSELVYLTGFGDKGRYTLHSAQHGLGFGLSWDATVLPYCWFWQEFGAITGYPWYGRHYNIGLEPFSSFPTNGLAGAVINDTAMTLGPREGRRLWLRADVARNP
ncbi:MAG: aldose 1-epimerase [Thermomicrobiales bacterium]